MRGDAGALAIARGGVEFDGVALPVAEAECAHVETLGLGDREHGGGVEASAEEDDGRTIRHGQPPKICCSK